MKAVINIVNIRDTKLYVEEHGAENEEALLYLHGGPGSSCLDFCHYQAQALSSSLRVIAIDQRGVLRSEPLQEEERCGIDDLIADCEALRKYLNIEQWSVLGHSFGGFVALLYAHRCPQYVQKVLYEAPSFDLGLSMRALLKKAKTYFESSESCDTEHAVQCDTYLQNCSSTEELWNAWRDVIRLLGDRKDYIYFHGIEPQEYNRIHEAANIAAELWQRTQLHTRKIEEDGKVFTSLLPLLSEVTQPSLLLHGALDPVCCTEQKERFERDCANGRVTVFDNSAHFPRLEEAEKYTTEVLKFILEI
jgi:proline iminopeptidase